MVNYLHRRPRRGSTDWAAQQFLRMLEREEQEAAGLKHLQETGWSPPLQPTSASDGDVVFGDGRDAVVDHVQGAIDRRNQTPLQAALLTHTLIARASLK